MGRNLPQEAALLATGESLLVGREAGLGRVPSMDRLDVSIAPGMAGQGIGERAVSMLQGNVSDRSACQVGGEFIIDLTVARENAEVLELNAADDHIALQQ